MYTEIATGHALCRVLFDCGQGCLDTLAVHDAMAIDAVCFSHFHIDHIAGFDALLRLNFFRHDPPLRLFGPPGAADVLQHRLQGFTWNLVEGEPGTVEVTDIGPEELVTRRFLLCERFATAHEVTRQPFTGVVHQSAGYVLTATLMDHQTPSVAYHLHEHARENVDTARLAALGLPNGEWVRAVKDHTQPDETALELNGHTWSLGQLRSELLVRHAGDSVAYLTDFRLTPETKRSLLEMLSGCRTMVCENNYANDDAELAHRNYHMTSREVGTLAAQVDPQRLVLFHVSDRYTRDLWQAQLAEVRQHFPRAEFPPDWNLN